MSCVPGEACWIRAGEPLVLHWIGPETSAAARSALCGVTSVAWRCVDGDGVTATECTDCARAAGQVFGT